MENKEDIISKITQLLLTKQEKWRKLSVDMAGAVAFIDLQLNDKSLTIEVTRNHISFSFEDKLLYFSKDPLDASFTRLDLAIEYLEMVINLNHTKKFDINYNGREYHGIIKLKSVDPHRISGTERIYDIMISDGSVTHTVADISEYPEGKFTIYKHNPSVIFSETELINFITH